jgi:hypothetical protein
VVGGGKFITAAYPSVAAGITEAHVRNLRKFLLFFWVDFVRLLVHVGLWRRVADLAECGESAHSYSADTSLFRHY